MLFDAHAVTLSPSEQFVLDLGIVSVAIASLLFTDSSLNQKTQELFSQLL